MKIFAFVLLYELKRKNHVLDFPQDSRELDGTQKKKPSIKKASIATYKRKKKNRSLRASKITANELP